MRNFETVKTLSHKYAKFSVCMGTIWIVCAEPKHDTTATPIGNHHEHRHELQQRQFQQQEQQLQQQQQQQQQTSLNYERIRRRSKPLHDQSGRWVCDVCGRTYNRGDSLAHHRSIHRGDTICPICQAVFTRKYTMRCHMFNVHGVK
ncbi:hypothetical protein K0M31_013841 [Melipona bicolor]|uniref:C2H2-type domain-containing protein n=1 Tax=Melipona bicolor TaxID=60889 RepID=A0AA40G829_9HYME|nr:hypothetical protein K0M31_013841 [Melipona bicolor]